jgi:hypothetical protein
LGPSIKDVSTEGEGGGLEGSETISPLRVIKPKAMKNDKGREGGRGGQKIEKMGLRRLWMAPCSK